ARPGHCAARASRPLPCRRPRLRPGKGARVAGVPPALPRGRAAAALRPAVPPGPGSTRHRGPEDDREGSFLDLRPTAGGLGLLPAVPPGGRGAAGPLAAGPRERPALSTPGRSAGTAGATRAGAHAGNRRGGERAPALRRLLPDG